MCAALFLNFHGSQGLSAPLQRARSPENLQHSGCYHRVDRNMIHFTYRHFQRDYSCRVHGTLSVSHWLLWQARAPHRRIAPASASCDANLSMAILSHGTDGCQYITSILLISVYPFMICIFRSPRSRSPRLNAARQTNRINAPRKWCFWRWPSARQRAFSPALRVPSCSSVSPALSIKTADGRPYGRPSVGFRSYFS